MTFNLGSLCIAILWNSIFIGIVFWMGKKKIYTTRKGIQLTLMFYLLGVVRMIFPIDFRPSIGIQVSKGIFPIINNVIGLEKHNLWGRQFTIAYALAAIWLIIAGVFMLRYFVKYQEMRRIFQKYSTEANEQYQSPSHDATLLLDSMILGLEEIEDSNDYEKYIDIIFKEV